MKDQERATVQALAPCPFCGGASIFVEPDEHGSGGQWVPPVHVGCSACKAEQRGESPEEAVAAWNRRIQAQPSGDPADPLLCKFYGVTTDADLIAAQHRHIEKLQAKLPPTPSFAPQRVREG